MPTRSSILAVTTELVIGFGAGSMLFSNVPASAQLRVAEVRGMDGYQPSGEYVKALPELKINDMTFVFD